MWRWWRGGGMVRLGVSRGSRRSGEEGDWQKAAPRSGCRATRDWRCVWSVCGLLELSVKATAPHPPGRGRCIGYERTRH